MKQLPYLRIVKELETKHDYVASFLRSGMIALVSETQIAWIETRKGSYYLYRQLKENQVECLRLSEEQCLIVFVHLVEGLKKTNERYKVVEVQPNMKKYVREDTERIRMWLDHLYTAYTDISF